MLWFFVALREFGGAFIRIFRDPKTQGLAVVTAILLGVGTLFYMAVEGWSALDALYFCVVSLATVGYGDLTPVTPLGRLFTIFFILSGVGVIVLFATTIAENALGDRTRRNAALRARLGKGTADEPPSPADEDQPPAG